MELAETFAQFVAATEFRDLDHSVIEHARKMMLKQVMGLMVGSVAPASRKVIRYAKDSQGKPESGVYGCGFKTDVAQAALLAGFFGHASEMEDDIFPGSTSDVTTVPALLPVAQQLRLSGQEIITAFYVGQEVQNRIAYWGAVGLEPSGLAPLPTIGIFGATASCTSAYGLTKEETRASFGLALVQGLGYVHTFGTDAHYWESATVCRNGVLNALMAKEGATSSPLIEKSLDILTGGDKNIQFDKMTEGLGQPPYYSNETWLKKWGFCFWTHNFVDVLADMMRENSVAYEDVEEVLVHFDEIREIVDRPQPKTIDDSRFSIQHILGYQMVHGECGLETCTDMAVHDPRIIEAREKVKVVYHPEYPKMFFAGEGRLDIKLRDGKSLTGAMDQVVDIYRKYCQGILSDAHIERVKDIVLNMENEPDLEELYDICTFRHLVR